MNTPPTRGTTGEAPRASPSRWFRANLWLHRWTSLIATLPFLVLFASGYALVAGYSIHHELARLTFARAPRAELAEPAEPITSEPIGAPALSILSER